MAYRFKFNETMTQGFERIATEQIDRAAAHLATLDEAAVTSIHETRKCLKRTRALLRFCRPGLQDHAFESLNRQLRDIGRSLSGTRDADVLRQTISSLAQTGLLKSAIDARLQGAVALTKEAGGDEALGGKEYRDTAAQLRLVRNEISTVELNLKSCAIDTRGFVRAFEACHSAFEPACDDEDNDALHEWRKTVQTHWRHMQLINRAWPAYFDARIAEARSISMLIGEVRDLALLLEFATGAAAARLTPAMTASIKKIVSSKQERLRNEARLRGARLLGEKPKGIARRIQAYWEMAAGLKGMRSKPGLGD